MRYKPNPVFCDQSSFWSTDKLQHFLGATILSFIATHVVGFWGAVVAFAVMVGVELYEWWFMDTSLFSRDTLYDLVYDFAGCGFGWLLTAWR